MSDSPFVPTSPSSTSDQGARSMITITTTVSVNPVALSPTISAVAQIPIGCKEDNCLRAMIREGNIDLTPFCRLFTTATVNDLAALPTYASMCKPNAVSGISSACSCLVPKTAMINVNGTQTSAPLNITTATVLTTTTVTLLTTLVTTTVTSDPVISPVPVGCAEDNCLRAMIREGNLDATPFCQTFTTAVISDTAVLPTYASMCTPNAVSGISSACSCFVPKPTGFSNDTVSSNLTSITLPSNTTSAQTIILTEASNLSNAAPGLGVENIVCNEDNCLRAMIREGNIDATPFCNTFTTAVTTEEAVLPSYASMCTPGRVAGISSACSCYVPPPTQTPTPTGRRAGYNEDNCRFFLSDVTSSILHGSVTALMLTYQVYVR